MLYLVYQGDPFLCSSEATIQALLSLKRRFILYKPEKTENILSLCILPSRICQYLFAAVLHVLSHPLI